MHNIHAGDSIRCYSSMGFACMQQYRLKAISKRFDLLDFLKFAKTQLIKDIMLRQMQMSVNSSSANLTGLSVYTKEDEDQPVGKVEDVDETGNLLIIRGTVDSKEYSVPKNAVIDVDKSSNKIVLYMTRDDFIKYAKV